MSKTRKLLLQAKIILNRKNSKVWIKYRSIFNVWKQHSWRHSAGALAEEDTVRISIFASVDGEISHHGGKTSSQIWNRSYKLNIMSLNENFAIKKRIWPRWQQPWALDTSFYNKRIGKKGVTASSNMIPMIWTMKFVLKAVKTTKVDSFLLSSCFWALSCTCLSFLSVQIAVSALNP